MPRTVTGGGRVASSRLPAEVGPALEGRGRDATPGVPAMSGDRVGAQAGLAERRDAQVGPTDEVVDGAAHRCLDARAGGQAGEQDGDAERDAERAQDRAQRSRPEAAEGEVRSTTWRIGPTARGWRAAR